MSLRHSNAPSIDLIDAEIDGGFRDLRFREPLERQYEEDSISFRRRNLLVSSIVGLILYDAFIVNDWRMLPDIFREALILRLAVFTPLAAFGIAGLAMSSSFKAFEKYACLIAIISVMLIECLFSISDSIYRAHYQYGSVMIMVFAAVVQRLRVRYLLVVLSGILATQFTATYRSSALDSITFQSAYTLNVTIAILVVFAAYGLERERRRSYLLSIRSRLMNDELERSAKIDPLTGLWNRRHLNATMEAAWANTDASRNGMTVILLDVDHFKTFNDTYGHLEGDNCLARIGACLRDALDDMENIAVRFGGEEFLVFLPGLDADQSQRAARILRQAIRYEAIAFPALGAQAIVTASIGVATGRPCDVPAAALMAEADAAMYEAKKAGRDCIFPREADVAICAKAVA